MLNEEKLKLYLKNNFNVLLEGPHGVGKTAVIKKLFEDMGLKWKYFSASTMDPWVDFIGVPKSVKDKNGQETLELIKPKDFANDEVEAIFFDEFNRAPAKVMNAVMELIQFKSINGKKFNNLKVIWAAINPHDENNTYQVQDLDPATKDRFHIFIKVPAELDAGYLLKTHGSLAKPFIKWWNELPNEIKTNVSPRRVDYAIGIHTVGGDLKDCLPKDSNIAKLYSYIKEASESLELEKLANSSNEQLKKFFTLENTMKYAQRILSEPFADKMVPFFNKDFVESNIQATTPTDLSYSLVRHAFKNEDFTKSLSDKSQTIIKEAKKRQEEVQPYQMDSTLEEFVQTTVNSALKFGAKTFTLRINEAFEFYCQKLKKQNSADIVPFFKCVFATKDSNGQLVKDRIYNILSEDFKNMSTSTPGEKSAQATMGFLYNFGLKFAYLDGNPKAQKMEKFIEDLISVSKKTRTSRGNKDAREILYSFEEAYWPELKETLLNKGNLKTFTASQEFKNYSTDFETKPEKDIVFKRPGSIQQAQEVFATKKGLLLGTQINTNNVPSTAKKKARI